MRLDAGRLGLSDPARSRATSVHVIGIHNTTVQDFQPGVGYTTIASLGVSASAFADHAVWLDPKYATASGIRDSAGRAAGESTLIDPATAKAAWYRLGAEKGVARAPGRSRAHVPSRPGRAAGLHGGDQVVSPRRR
jgi:hypothetical protein